MKPRIGVYLSEQIAARLAATAKLRGASKSALVEAALAAFLGSDDDADNPPVDRRLSLMSRQLEQLDRDLRIVNETVALQARYQLAVTPPLPAAALRAACALGAERFDELATQVWRRVQSGTSLVQETVDRLSHKRDALADGKGTTKTFSPVLEPDLRTSNPVNLEVEHSTAGREGGSLLNFPGKTGLPLH
ncbi:ribbon-helix-helix domain-containing protein [Bradyrhizobium sp. 170]|uniref:ribbon-helix-helix domain-containing protein n=1 Tax=Bradyrhizobium sp. 170 TaxID=2782641 RepID=UPI001FFF84D0|nr:ribbon-helix-helix domain-containing protein [Bradyrhizobium sp. 170]UPK06362.1 ribbon-helix-helix protein, CopG family [Bradyrhizobium sp. 170]